MKIFTPIALAAATAAVATVGLAATPAQASTTSSGCTVTPHVVRFYDYNANNKKRVLLRVDIKCHNNRWINLAQQGWEDDNTPNDTTDDRWYTKNQWVKVNANTLHRVNTITVMPDTPNDGAEELYQKARYRVRTIEQYPVTSEWTQWESTPYRTISN